MNFNLGKQSEVIVTDQMINVFNDYLLNGEEIITSDMITPEDTQEAKSYTYFIKGQPRDSEIQLVCQDKGLLWVLNSQSGYLENRQTNERYAVDSEKAMLFISALFGYREVGYGLFERPAPEHKTAVELLQKQFLKTSAESLETSQEIYINSKQAK